MKLLVVSPDYASHYLPLSAVAAEAARRGFEVVVATGTALREQVQRDGFRWTRLTMSAGSNAGTSGTASDDLSEFFAATRRGMVATLLQQAEARSADLLWEPEAVARATIGVVDAEQPGAIIADHLAFAATLGLRAAGRPFTTFVPGHPGQLPLGDERYGVPTAWPVWAEPSADGLAALRRRCAAVTEAVTERANATLARLDPGAAPVADVFAAHGDDVLYNSPVELHDPARTALLPARHAFLGSCVRSAAGDAGLQRWMDDGPYVYVSLGTFLSARTDVLRVVTDALAGLGVRAAVATGSADPACLGALPGDWLVEPFLAEVQLLDGAGAVVTHGGNNTVTEALTAACPALVLPLSTDQFAIAADLERGGLARSMDPNGTTVTELATAIGSLVAGPEVTELAARLRLHPGPAVAADRLGPVRVAT